MTIEVAEGTLLVSVTGDRPESDLDACDQWIECWRSVADACREHGLGRVLLASSVDAVGSSYVAHSIFSDFDRFGFARATRIAIVRLDTRARRVLHLGVEVARDHGWRMQMFASVDDARLWLAGDGV